MKKLSFFENLVYYAFCIFTLGGFYITRVLITRSVLKALESHGQNSS